MATWVIIIASIGLSLSIWGLIRTSLWILPSLFFQDGSLVVSGCMMSFIATAAIVAPFRNGAFDVRGLDRQRLTLILFLSGVLTGTLFYPVTMTIFASGAIVPLLALILFKIFKQPASEILFLPKQMKWIPVVLWIICFAALNLESLFP